MRMEDLRLTFINVGYGEAILLECPDPAFEDGVFTMLIDGGSNEDIEYAGAGTGRIPAHAYLRRRGVGHIDLLVNTHIHEDHLCGLLPAAELLPPAALWQILPEGFYRRMRPLQIPDGITPSRSKFLHALNDYQTLCQRLDGRRIPVRRMSGGQVGALCQGLSARVLAPASSRGELLVAQMEALYNGEQEGAFWEKLDQLDASMNNFSMVLLLEYRGTRILLPGDTNEMGYGGLEAEDLRADLFKVGHHGQRDGVSEAQIQAIRPKAVVCCASSDRRYNSAHPDILRMMASHGAALYFSDCPEIPDRPVPPPHQALCFSIGADGRLEPEYQSI